jgi:hypothetical protein
MQKKRLGRPSSGIPRKQLSLMFTAPEYWEIYDRARKSGKSISHYVAGTLLADWRFKRNQPSLIPQKRSGIVSELEKAIMTNSISNVQMVLAEYKGTSDIIFSSGRVKCVYEDKDVIK